EATNRLCAQRAPEQPPRTHFDAVARAPSACLTPTLRARHPRVQERRRVLSARRNRHEVHSRCSDRGLSAGCGSSGAMGIPLTPAVPQYADRHGPKHRLSGSYSRETADQRTTTAMKKLQQDDVAKKTNVNFNIQNHAFGRSTHTSVAWSCLVERMSGLGPCGARSEKCLANYGAPLCE